MLAGVLYLCSYEMTGERDFKIELRRGKMPTNLKTFSFKLILMFIFFSWQV